MKNISILFTFLIFFTSSAILLSQSADSLIIHASNLVKQGHDEDALKCLDEIIKTGTDDNMLSLVYSTKGIILFKTFHKNKEALMCYNEAIFRKPDFYIFWLRKGEILYSERNFDEAIKCYDKAIEINPDNDEAWYYRASIFSLRKNKKEMLVNLKKAFELDHNNKEEALRDKVFEEFWNDPDFVELVK